MSTHPQSSFKLPHSEVDGFLTHTFLIASPSLQDPRFKNTVVYLCVHNAQQAMGIIINRPKPELYLSSMLPHLDVEGSITHADTQVLYGGPVEMERGFVLHSRDFFDDDNSLVLSDTLALSANKSVLEALILPEAPKKAVLALGYAGWDAGQLDGEIKQNSWLVAPADETLIFEGSAEKKWKTALASLGIAPELLSPHAGQA